MLKKMKYLNHESNKLKHILKCNALKIKVKGAIL